MLSTLSIRELRLCVLGAGSVVVVALAMVLIVPGAKQLRSLTSEIDFLYLAGKDQSELARNLAAAESENETLRFKLYGDLADVPSNQVEAHIIGRLQQISWRAGIQLVGIQPSVGEQVQIFSETLFRIEVVGEYNDLFRWLWSVRSELGYVVVKEYSLQRTDNDDEDPQLLASVTLATYRAIE